MSRLALFIHIEDEISEDLNKDRKKALHLTQKSYWQEYYSDRISYDTFNRIYKAWKAKVVA
jgi:hypothetical protein